MINIAVIGCGRWGMNYVRLLHEMPDIRLVSACDGDSKRRELAQGRFPQLEIRENMDTVMEDNNVEAVIIATPAATHHAIVKRALKAGKHVLVEKPLTTTVEDAVDLEQTAAAENRLLMVGLTFLYNSGIQKMREAVHDPAFGTIYYLHLTRTNLGPVRQDVSAIWDLASHDLAICSYLLEKEPIWVQANAAKVLGQDQVDVAFITLGYADGTLANIHVSWVDPNKVREVVAVGSQQRIVFDDLNPGEPIRIYEKGISASRQEANSFGDYRLLTHEGGIYSPRISPAEPLREQVAHFIDCITVGKQPVSDARMAVENVRQLAAIENSLNLQGMRIPIKPSQAAHAVLEESNVPLARAS